MRLILIRHAASKHSALNQISGIASCTGLTQEGITQSEKLKSRLLATSELNACTRLISSPVLRAYQTAEILTDALPVKEITQHSGICELEPGDADGLTTAEYHSVYGSFDLVAFPERPFAPNGESWIEFINRVGATLEQFTCEFEGQTIVAISHAGFIMASLLVLFNIPRPGTGAYLDPTNTSLTEWQFSNGIWRLIRYNDTYHLSRGYPVPEP